MTGADPIPRTLRVAADVSWRLLVVGAAIVVVALLVVRLRLVVLPVIVAILLATVLTPPARALAVRGVPRSLATGIVLLAALAVLVGVQVAAAPSAAGEFGDLEETVRGGIDELERWLVEGPLGLPADRVEAAFEPAAAFELGGGAITGGAVGGALLIAELVAGAILTFTLLFFFVRDGEALWAGLVALGPAERRDAVDRFGRAAWTTLGGYLRGVAIVAAFDAVFIGLALLLIGVPLVVPLAFLTFLGGFIPIVGAVVAGFAATMVALVTEGWVAALLVLAAVLAVQQIEGNVLQPLVVGRAVALHPVVILLAVAAGGVLWGVIGAFVAVPLVAVLVRGIPAMRRRPPVQAMRAAGGDIGPLASERS